MTWTSRQHTERVVIEADEWLADHRISQVETGSPCGFRSSLCPKGGHGRAHLLG